MVHRKAEVAYSLTLTPSHDASVGAQAIVAWSLQKDMPNVPFSMVAEEDSDDLRYVNITRTPLHAQTLDCTAPLQRGKPVSM